MRHWMLCPLLALAACATDGSSAPTTTAAAKVEPKLSAIQKAIFTPKCANVGCHGTPGPSADLDLTEGKSHAALVGKLAQEKQPQPWKLVEPGKSAESLLYQLVAVAGNGMVGNTVRMPMGGGALTADEQAAIKAWIDAGAKND
jgi:hypothetical protein